MDKQEFEMLRERAYEKMQKMMENATTDSQRRKILNDYNEYMRYLRSNFEWSN